MKFRQLDRSKDSSEKGYISGGACFATADYSHLFSDFFHHRCFQRDFQDNFALPKIFEERLGGIATSASFIGSLALFVFAIASFAQIVVGKMLDRIIQKGFPDGCGYSVYFLCVIYRPI